MIIGTGLDICDIRRIKMVIKKFPKRFKKRCFTPKEIKKCDHIFNSNECYAKRFAAKEAISKALGSGMRLGVRFRDILILSDLETGQPLVQLRGRAKQQASEKGINRILISISDEKEYAMAFAMGLSF